MGLGYGLIDVVTPNIGTTSYQAINPTIDKTTDNYHLMDDDPTITNLFENFGINTITFTPTFEDCLTEIDSNEWEWESCTSSDYDLNTLWDLDNFAILTFSPSISTISFANNNDKLPLRHPQLIDWDQQHHIPVVDLFQNSEAIAEFMGIQ